MRLRLFAGRRGAHTGWPCEDHLDREQEQQHTAAHLECLHTDGQQLDQLRSRGGKNETYDRSDCDCLGSHPSSVRIARTLGQAREHGQQRQRLDDYQQHDEELDQIVEHHDPMQCTTCDLCPAGLQVEPASRRITRQQDTARRR